MKRVKQLWRKSPKARFYGRTAAVAFAGYVVQTVRAGEVFTWSGLVTGGGTAVITAILGLTTPIEPFVGFNKTRVDVPVPPAVPEPR